MNIPSKINKISSFYGHARYAFLSVFALTIIFTAFMSHSVYGDSVVGTVVTNLTLKIDGKTQNITTTQNTIGGALVQNGVAMAENDITEPPLDTYLSGKDISVQVVRAVPVLIADNGQSWPAFSAYTQPADILKQLRVEVFPEDKVSAELILDPALDGAIGQKVVIQRAPIYTIYVDDTTKVVRSWATTVGDLLNEKGISLGANDIVEPGKTALLTGVTEINVTRINYADIEEIVDIPFHTVEQKDYNMYQGKSEVIQGGVSGTKKQIVHLVYKNGVEIERMVTSTTVLETEQDKVVRVGVKPYGMDDLWPFIVGASKRYGVDAEDMVTVMLCESHGNVESGRWNGARYKGLYQWDSYSTLYDTYVARAGFPGADYYNPEAQIYATALRVMESGYHWYAWGTCSVG